MPTSPKDTARLILEVTPLVMRTMRAHMRDAGVLNLSVPQFRTLGFVSRDPQRSLSELAEHIGLTLPAMSKLVEGLVERKLVLRRDQASDRRRITLELTARGADLLQSAHAFTENALAQRLSTVCETDRCTIASAMKILQPLFAREKTDAPKTRMIGKGRMR